MSESILDTIKQMLGLDLEDQSYDNELVVYINSALSDLVQIGVGPTTGYQITGKDDVWETLLEANPNLNSAKQFIYLKVRLVFDPPQTSYVIQAFEKQIEEATFRINVHAEA